VNKSNSVRVVWSTNLLFWSSTILFLSAKSVDKVVLTLEISCSVYSLRFSTIFNHFSCFDSGHWSHWKCLLHRSGKRWGYIVKRCSGKDFKYSFISWKKMFEYKFPLSWSMDTLFHRFGVIIFSMSKILGWSLTIGQQCMKPKLCFFLIFSHSSVYKHLGPQ
jgi:hypothetical protein